MWYERTLVTYLLYGQTFGRPLQASLKKIEKNIEMNFTDTKGLDLSYYDVDFFGAPLEKTDYLMKMLLLNDTSYM